MPLLDPATVATLAGELAENALLDEILNELQADCLAAFASHPVEELERLQLRYQVIEQVKQDILNKIIHIREAG